MRRALVVHYHFLPYSNVGIKQFAKYCYYLREFGWEAVVLTRDWASGPTQEDKRWGLAFDPELAASVGAGTSTIAVPYTAYRHSLNTVHRWLKARTSEHAPWWHHLLLGGPRRALSLFWPLFGSYPDELAGWAKPAVATGIAAHALQPFNAILSNCPPQTNHIVASALATRLRLPWVPYFGDLYGFYVGPGDWHGAPLRRLLVRRLNRRLLRPAVSALVVSPHMGRVLADLYRLSSQVVVVGFDEAEFPPQAPEPGEARFTVAHVGSVYPGDERPEIFFDGVDLFLDQMPSARSRLQIRFVGSRVEEYLRQLVHGRRSTPVYCIQPKVSTSEATRLQRAATVLLLLSPTAGRLAGGTLSYPSKIFEYFGAGRPILAVPGDGDWVDFLLRKTRAGVTADSAEEVATQLEYWYTEWARYGHLSHHPRSNTIRDFTHREQARRLAAVLNEVAR